MAKKTQASAEYLRIRRYVLLLAQKSGASSVLLPSNQELADQFGVSRPTVSKAMRALVKEGFILGKRGIGSFTNPMHSSDWKLKNVGILYGDGMYVWYDGFSARYYGSFFVELARLQCSLQPLTFNSGSPDELGDEIVFRDFDALICVLPRENVIRTLRRHPALIAKTVLVDGTAPGFTSVCMDFDRLGYETGSALVADGCRNPAFLFNHAPWNLPLRGFLRAFTDAGIDIPSKHPTASDVTEIIRALGQMQSRGERPDALFIPVCRTDQTAHILQSIQATPQNTRLIFCGIAKNEFPDFRGCFYRFPFEETARETGKLVEDILQNNGIAPVQKQIPIAFEHRS